jgi:hypothetical protein
MMIPNPDDARKINKMHEKLMGTPNLPKEIEKPGKDGPSLDSQIKGKLT